MTNHHYSAYGLHIKSELAFPELQLATARKADVNIYYGDTPDALTGSATKLGIWEAKQGKFLLHIDDIARYLVLDGREICIQPATGSCEEDIRVFTLGSVMAALLQQREILTLHASAIQTEHGAILFMGHSGAGKSTLSAAFSQRGCALLADDVSGIHLDGHGIPKVLPSFPHNRLWADTVDRLNHDGADRQRIRAGLEKYVLPAANYCIEAQPVIAAYTLNIHNREKIELEPIEKVERFQCLYKYTYRKRILRALNQQAPHFEVASAVASSTRMKCVTRPSYPFMLDELVDRLEEDFSLPK